MLYYSAWGDFMKLGFTLIRHGATAGSWDRRYLGLSANPSLSEHGKQDIQDRKRRGIYPNAEAVYISPLICCVETVPLIYPMLVPVVLDFLSERDFGSFEGKSYDQLKNDPDYRRFIESGDKISPPCGENKQEFMERLSDGLHYIADTAIKRHIHNTALITHDDCIMSLITQFRPSELDAADYQTNYGGGFQIEIESRSFSLLSVKSL